jgi:hypothetical protein
MIIIETDRQNKWCFKYNILFMGKIIYDWNVMLEVLLQYSIHILQEIQKFYCFEKVVHNNCCCVTVLIADEQPSSVA